MKLKERIHYRGMKYLGVDYGTKRIGVAVSDESATLAFPLGTVAAGEKALGEVLDIIRENGVKVAVIGESLNLKMQKNPIMKDIEKFAEALQAHGVVAEFEQELFTSAQAEHQFGGRPGGREVARKAKAPEPEHHDASAAALILQSYLDRMRKNH